MEVILTQQSTFTHLTHNHIFKCFCILQSNAVCTCILCCTGTYREQSIPLHCKGAMDIQAETKEIVISAVYANSVIIIPLQLL